MKNLNHFLSGLALFSVLQIGAGAQTNTNYLRLDVGAVSNFFTLTLFGTQSNFNYQILSRDDLKGAPWVSETFVVGPTNTNFAFATISMTNWSRRFFVAGSGEDSDGDGLPDIYELMVTHTDPFNPDTGNTGTMDGAKDLDGDGLSNLEEYLAKTSPVAFSAPPPPFNFKATQTNANGNVLLTWEAVNGPVTNYVIVTDILVGNTVQTIELARLSSNTLSYLDTRGAQSYPPRYRIRALFPGGESASSADVFINTPPARTSAGALLTHGPNGRFRLTVSAPPANLDSVRITRHAANAYYPLIDYAPGAASGWPYANYSTLSNAPSDTNVTLLVENFTNGVAALPETFVPNGFDYTFDVQLILTNNVLGPGESVRVYDSDSADNAVFPPRWVSWGWIGHDWPGYKLPFVDGRANLRANMHFLLRGATATEPFEYQQAQHGAGAFGSDLPYYLYPASTNYVYADFFWRHPLSDQQSYVANDWTPLLISSLNPFLPFHDNRRFQNWLFKASDVVSNGLLGTGVDWNYDFNPGHLLLENPKYVFDEFGFVDNGLTNEPTPQLTGAQDRWIFRGMPYYEALGIGLTLVGNTWVSSSSQRNVFGLAYQSFIVTSSSNAYANYLVGSSFSFTTWRAIFQDVADPVLQTESYLFETDVRKFPGNINFNTTNTTPLLIAGVGRPFQVAGWAKQSIANGYSSKFAYLGQYFDKAFKADTNGYATTNQTGVLSEYGEFLPTEPGRVILTTKPDLDTGAQAQCGVYCIKLELDVNHDGVMDHSLNGPDNTSQSRPFVFWLNDDRDGIGEGEEKYSGDPDYLDGHIKSRRDLEDFARLWISGMPPLSHSVTAFAGCSVKLHWRDPFNAPSIKIYAAADTNGSIGYLTETNAANQQITGYYEYGFANLTHFYDALVEIAPDTDWFIPDDYFGDGGRTKFIFEGSGVGEGELVLTVSRQGQIVGETSVWIAIKPITELYEWAEAVDVATNKPPAGLQSRYLLRNRMPVNATEQKDVIVFVHGINNKLEEARRSAETTFKRLYWQGYRGRIAGFFWPQPLLPECAFTVPRGSPYNYDIGEFFAWKSAKAFKEYLEYLRTTSRLKDYSIHILGHSQGNIVVSEALRQGAPFDDFILSQAAAPAHCYSTNAPFLQRFLNKESEAGQQTPFTYQEGGYHGCFTNLTGRIISFYNTNDYALAKGFCTEFLETNWEANQENYKPEYYTYGGVIDSWGFNTNTRQSWYLQSTPLVTVSNFVTDLHIAKSFVARSRSRAVGAQDNMAGVIQASVNLNAPPFNFGRERTEHSAQFAYPIQGAGPYWQQVLSSFGISPF